MVDSITILANAKLNLSLDITGRRPDGFHTLEMVMQSVDIYDTVTLNRTAPGVTVSCDNKKISNGIENLAYKAAMIFFDAADINGGVSIKIKKRIPIAAGLGGGSADAAAVLTGLNQMYGLPLAPEELEKLGLKAGADVPFCLTGGTQLAEGIGSILTPLPELQNCAFVVVKTGGKPSTGEMYKRFDALPEEQIMHPATRRLVNAICEGDLPEMAEYIGNVFEPLWQHVDAVRTDLLQNGALCACLSGSGPSVFGLFASIDDAEDAKKQLEDRYPEIFVCEPQPAGYITD